MTSGGRTDSAQKFIRAPAQTVYRALLDPHAIQVWRRPQGMKSEITAFDPREGGVYRMSLTYDDADRTATGKTTRDSDVFEGRFLELAPNERVVEAVRFESADPAFSGEMIVVTTLTPAPGGVTVEIRCENTPIGIRPEDHAAGIAAALENLAAFTE